MQAWQLPPDRHTITAASRAVAADSMALAPWETVAWQRAVQGRYRLQAYTVCAWQLSRCSSPQGNLVR